jgi:hypothetical protein
VPFDISLKEKSPADEIEAISIIHSALIRLESDEVTWGFGQRRETPFAVL